MLRPKNAHAYFHKNHINSPRSCTGSSARLRGARFPRFPGAVLCHATPCLSHAPKTASNRARPFESSNTLHLLLSRHGGTLVSCACTSTHLNWLIGVTSLVTLSGHRYNQLQNLSYTPTSSSLDHTRHHLSPLFLCVPYPSTVAFLTEHGHTTGRETSKIAIGFPASPDHHHHPR